MPRDPDLLPDWFVGGAGKRKLLAALVSGEAAGKPPPWDKSTLARAAGLHEKHTVFRHVDVLVMADVLLEDTLGYGVNAASRLISPLRALLDELDRLPPRMLPASRGRRP
jgi:hypothetical protein